MWENETKQIKVDEQPQNKAYTLMMPSKNKEDSDKIMIVQAIICVIVIVFVLVSKVTSTQLFIEIKSQYQQIISSGIDISEQGELVRFISVFAQNIKEKVADALNSIDNATAKGGAENGSEISFISADFPYMLSVTPHVPVNKGTLSSKYGERLNPVTGKKEIHSGLDIKAKEGSHVFSSYGGQVEKSGNDKIRGNYIIIKHTNNLRTIYQHLSKIYVGVETKVMRGQIIGAVGSTGLSTGPHLHYELIIDRVSVNPSKALRWYK